KRDLGREALGHADSAHGERQRDERERQDCQRALSRHSNFSKRSPISPRGRSSSTRIIRTYLEASAAGGSNRTVMPRTTPTSNPAMTTPQKLPNPPITTT